MKLQLVDTFRYALHIRPVFPDMTDHEFSAWYSKRYMVTEKRVLKILEVLKP